MPQYLIANRAFPCRFQSQLNTFITFITVYKRHPSENKLIIWFTIIQTITFDSATRAKFKKQIFNVSHNNSPVNANKPHDNKSANYSLNYINARHTSENSTVFIIRSRIRNIR